MARAGEATVFAWDSGTGHASIGVTNSEGLKTYLSFHPVGGLGNEVRNVAGMECDGVFGKFADDSKYAGVKEITIPDTPGYFDAAAAMRCANGLKSSVKRYHLYTHNCATLVMEVLCAGAHEEFHALKTFEDMWRTIRLRRMDHGRGFDFMREAFEVFAGARALGLVRTIGKRMTPAVFFADVMSRVFTWTPGDVYNYAHDIVGDIERARHRGFGRHHA